MHLKPQQNVFGDITVFSDLTPEARIGALQALGEIAVGEEAQERTDSFLLFGRTPKPYEYGAHSFGYIEAPLDAAATDETLSISNASVVDPDLSLQNIPLWIGLGGLQVADYPGRGKRTILFDFYGRNHVGNATEDLHFNAKYDVQDKDYAGILNMPIFVGLNAGTDGLSFQCTTVNVANHEDEAFLTFLESDEFKAGLQLATTLQPAIGAFSATALGITKSIAKRNSNIAVQKFALGLDFSMQTAAGARLREGTYVAAQIPQEDELLWSWDRWIWNRGAGRIISKDNASKPFPFNTVLINVRRQFNP